MKQQGSFWLADHGSVFIEERHGSSYYNDPLYQSWYTQPIGHSTILIDGNHQSQRAGDPLMFAEGFKDHAYIDHFLDGKDAAFATGDIGRLYWGKVKGLQRNVLYMKPRTVLMLDTIEPAEHDVNVTLLYQTLRLEDITAGTGISTITKGNSSRTGGQALVMVNLLTTTTGGRPEVNSTSGNGFTAGKTDGIDFVFTTNPRTVYSAWDFATDALAVTWNESRIFAAMTTSFAKSGKLIVSAEAPITFELSPDGMKYYHSTRSEVTFGVNDKPQVISVNGTETRDFIYNSERKTVALTLPAGEGMIRFSSK